MCLVTASALRTFTLTIWPALTVALGSLLYRLESYVDVNEAVLMDANFNRHAELRDVGDVLTASDVGKNYCLSTNIFVDAYEDIRIYF